MDLLYAGFDGLDVAFQGCIPIAAVDDLDDAKDRAQQSKRAAYVEIGGFKGHVAETGAKGGFAFCVDTGDMGFTWFFAKNQNHERWNIRVSCKSATLAACGFDGTVKRMYQELDAIGATVLEERIGRVDFAIDWRVPGDFRLDPERFAMHGTTKADMHGAEITEHWQARKCTGINIGKMPGRQISIYDKRRDIVAKRKAEWWSIWGIDREEFEASGDQIYRIEVRAGKKHLKEQWGILTWSDLQDKLGDVYAHAFMRIRYKECRWGEGENVSRVDDDAWWDKAREIIQENLFEWSCGTEPGVVKQVMEDQQKATIASQIIGLSANFAVLANVSEGELEYLPGVIASMISNSFGQDLEEREEGKQAFAEKMQKVFRRYEIIDRDGVIRGGMGFTKNSRGKANGEKTAQGLRAY
jgi:hypothetical protein